MLKIDMYADAASYKVGVDARPILRPSQFFGILNGAINGYDNCDATNAQICGLPIGGDIYNKYLEAHKIFSGITMFVSVTKSVGDEFSDYCTVDVNRWNDMPVKLLGGKDQTKPIAPFLKKYASNAHHTLYLDGADASVAAIKAALESPQSFLYIGRRNCRVCDMRVFVVDSDTLGSFCCAGSLNRDHLDHLGIECEHPNHIKLQIWPSQQIGKYTAVDWYEVDGQSGSPNYRLGRQCGEFVYIINRSGYIPLEWAHSVVYKYFGGVPWYISKGSKIVVFSRLCINSFGNLDVNRHQIYPKQSVRCSLTYVPKCYSSKEKDCGPRQKMTPERHARLENDLGVKLSSPRKISVVGKLGMNLDAYRYELKLDSAQFRKAAFRKFGKGQGRGYGALEPADINDII